MTTAALIVAAGRGTRMGSELPKQYLDVGGKPVLRHTIELFLSHPSIALVQVVIGEGDDALYHNAIGGLDTAKLLPFTFGGTNRSASVVAGLNALADQEPVKVLIHDAARLFCPSELITSVIDALATSEGAFAALPVVDALWLESKGCADKAVSRDGLWRAQTPQGFRYTDIVAAYQKAGPQSALDDVAIAHAAGLRVKMVPGSEDNFKVTTLDDLVRAERLANLQK